MRVAKSKDPSGPFIKRRHAILETDWAQYGKVRGCAAVLAVVTVVLQGVTWVGPGHGSVLQTGGAWWMFYHAWSSDTIGRQQPGRQLLLDRSISHIYCYSRNWKYKIQSKSSGSTGEEAGPSWAYPVSSRDRLLSSPSLDILSVTKNVFYYPEDKTQTRTNY